MRLGAQPFLWKWVLFAWEWKIISISKAEQLPSFWNRGSGELGSGLLALDLISSYKPELCLSRYLFCAKAEQPAMMIMMMMMMMMIIIIIAFLQHRKLLLTHYRNKKITDLYNYIILHTTTDKTDSYMNWGLVWACLRLTGYSHSFVFSMTKKGIEEWVDGLTLTGT